MVDRDPNGDRWTVDTLRVLIEANDLRYSQRFAAQSEALSAAFTAQQNAVNAALTAADRAVLKAETASEKRFDAVNEFRASLNDQSRLLMPRGECEKALATIKESLDELKTNVSQRQNISAGVKEGTQTSWALIVAIGVSAVNIIVIVSFLLHGAR
jgi:hypothetical protein